MIFLLISTTCLTLALSKFMENDYIEEMKLTEEFFEDDSFWSVVSYHFNSTRTLSLMIQKNYYRMWNNIASNLIIKMGMILNIPFEVFRFNADLVPAAKVPDFGFGSHVPYDVREYPAESSHSYLIVASDYRRILNFLDSSANIKRNWTSKDNYMVLIISHSHWEIQKFDWDIQENDIELVFDKFWVIKILNVIIVHKYVEPAYKIHDRIVVYDLFQRNAAKVMRVKPNEFSNLPKTYLERTWNLNRYPLKVTMFESFPNAILLRDSENRSYEGRDWKVITNLAEYMNFEVDIRTPKDGKKFGYRLKTGQFSGAMKDLIDGLADISGNERYIKYYNTNNIDFTMPAFYTKQLVVVVPKAQKLSLWRAISGHFNVEFWLYLLMIFLASTLLWYSLRKLHGKVSYLTNVLDMMSVFLTMSLSFIIRVTSHSQRIFLSFCMLFSLIVMCLLQSSLLDAIAHPHYSRDIDTLKQLDESGLSIATLDPNLLDTFQESQQMKNLNAKIFYTPLSSENILQSMVAYRNISLLTSKGEANWFMGKFQNMLHIVPEYPREYFVSYMIPKGSPYATRIHNLLGKMCAAGLVVKWDEETTYKLQLEALKGGRVVYPEKGSTTVFKLVDFHVAFMILGVGITASAVIFLVENSIGCTVGTKT